MPRVALLAHGAGSCPETALRLLGPAVPSGVEARAIDSRGTVDDVVGRLEDAASGHEVALVAGISLGAHAAATWCAAGGSARQVLLVMPAWTGAPADVASLTAATAGDVELVGIEQVLASVAAIAVDDDWVLDELRRGWASYDAAHLADALRKAASSPGPTPASLARITAPTALVALADDPLHPVTVARDWAALVPGARVATVGRHEPRSDRGVLGRTGRRLLDAGPLEG